MTIEEPCFSTNEQAPPQCPMIHWSHCSQPFSVRLFSQKTLSTNGSIAIQVCKSLLLYTSATLCCLIFFFPFVTGGMLDSNRRKPHAVSCTRNRGIRCTLGMKTLEPQRTSGYLRFLDDSPMSTLLPSKPASVRATEGLICHTQACAYGERR